MPAGVEGVASGLHGKRDDHGYEWAVVAESLRSQGN